MLTKTEDNLVHVKENARGWLEHIEEMVAMLDNEDSRLQDDATDRIAESALSVEILSAWYTPGSHVRGEDDANKPAEYCLLLSTGGPALRIIGTLDRFCEPETAQLQIQDWGTPWTDYNSGRADKEEILLAYARCFWFGE